MSFIVLCLASFLGRLPSIELSSGSVLFSTSAAMQLLVPPSEESKILNNKWLEWDISQLQVNIKKLFMYL